MEGNVLRWLGQLGVSIALGRAGKGTREKEGSWMNESMVFPEFARLLLDLCWSNMNNC